MARLSFAVGAAAIFVVALSLSAATLIGIHQMVAAERQANPDGSPHDQKALITFAGEPIFTDEQSINDLRISSSIVCEDFNPVLGNHKLIVHERRDAAFSLAWADWLLWASKYLSPASVRWLSLARQNRAANVAYFEPATLAANCRTVSERLAAIDRVRNPPSALVPSVTPYALPVTPNPLVEDFEARQEAETARARVEAAAREGAREGALEAARQSEAETPP